MVVLDQPHCAAPGKPSTARERVEERVRALVTEDSALRKKLQLDQVVLVGATTEESTGQVVFSKIVKPLDPAPVKRITVSTVSRTKKGEDYWNPAPVRKVTRTITPTLPAKPLVEWEDDARPPSGSEPAPIEIRAAALAAKK
jgi:hypothetical protein